MTAHPQRRFSRRSREQLLGVHPDLVIVATTCLLTGTHDFAVTDGIRTEDEQRALVESGASWTMDSDHLPQADGFAHAIDLAVYQGGRIRWEWPLYEQLREDMMRAAAQHGVAIYWGGEWKSRDGPHFGLRR